VELPVRLGAVLAVVNLILNEGYSTSSSEEVLRTELCDGAIRLAIGDRRLKGWSPGSRISMYPYVALRGPTYRENSHASHTWHQHAHQTACFKGPALPSL